jgi:hypothetical protein
MSTAHDEFFRRRDAIAAGAYFARIRPVGRDHAYFIMDGTFISHELGAKLVYWHLEPIRTEVRPITLGRKEVDCHVTEYTYHPHKR